MLLPHRAAQRGDVGRVGVRGIGVGLDHLQWNKVSLIFLGHFDLLEPILWKGSCLKCAKGAQVEIAGVAGPEKVLFSEFTTLFDPLISVKECRKMYKLAYKSKTHMNLLALTEYCKSMSSQSGRQSQSESDMFLIFFRNQKVSFELGISVVS